MKHTSTWHRSYTLADRLVIGLDTLLRGKARHDRAGDRAGKKYPGDSAQEAKLSAAQRRHAAGLMRVNHAGEVSAQALYEGQAVLARERAVRATLEDAAREEADHLAWCERRLSELDAEPSRLQPVWYAGSFVIGVLAATRGDAASLGFVAETERQVVEHLREHLERLPETDERSRAVLREMVKDEARHGTRAVAEGGGKLPFLARWLMRGAAKFMTRTAYWI